MRSLALVALWLIALPSFAAGFGPWTFGMSAEDIRAVESHGPYRAFSNGNLETYNAVFGGKKQNAQFYLKEDGLWRIALRVYEGADISKATQIWIETYTTLQDLYGSLETPGFSGDGVIALSESARAIALDGGKAQMAPVSQPESEFIFSSFNSMTIDGVTYYMVTVNYDQPAP